jgi:WD40 repeat protein
MRGISCLYPLDDRRILIDITNEGIYVFDTVSDAVIKKLDCHDSLLGRIVEGSTANELVICESGGDLLLLDTETLEVRRLFNTYDRFHDSIAVCSDGTGNLYMMKNNGLDQVHVYNINERRFVRRFTLPHSGSGTTLEFNKDKSLMLVTTPSCIKVCDVASGQSVASLYEDARRCNSARFSPDGAYIITTCANEVKLWDIRTALCYHTIEHGSMLGKVSISPDGTKFAFSSADRQVHVQDVIPIKELIDETRAHYADIGLSDAERKALHLE